MRPASERLFALLLRAYPRAFRERYADDLLEFFRAERRHPRFGTGPLRPLRFWTATTRDLARTAASERLPALTTLPTPNRATLMRTFTDIFADCRYALRSLRATPAVTVTALLVLTLGIGISTAIFSVVDGIVLRNLPFEDPDELMAVRETDLATGRPLAAAYTNYLDWSTAQDVFESLAASTYAPPMTTSGSERPERLLPYRITANLLDVLRVRPAIGPGFTARDVETSNRVALISDALWRRRFDADVNVVGKTIPFETGVYTVVGVMPPGFAYPIGSTLASRVDLWVPLVPNSREAVRGGARGYIMLVVGRLKPDVSLDQARARMVTIRNAMAAITPSWFSDRGVDVIPLKEIVVPKPVRSWMLMLLVAVVVVLLVACANVANLLLVRASGRSRELRVRAALGATRWRLVRGFIVESVILTGLGTACGVLLGYLAVDLLRVTLPADLPRVWAITVDLRVVTIAAAVALTAGVLCGMIPALQMARADLEGSLRASSRGSTVGRGRQRARSVFLIVEVALAAMLLVGAGIFTSSFIRIVRTDLGFQSDRRLFVPVSPVIPLQDRQQTAAIVHAEAALKEALSRLQVLPGVESAALIGGGVPLSGSWATEDVTVGDRKFDHGDAVMLKRVTSGYLDTVGATLISGRWIDDTDRQGSPPVIVLSDEAVRRYFGPGEPIGAKIQVEDGVPRTIVGVVRGMRLQGPEVEVSPEAYLPIEQQGNIAIFPGLVIHTSGDPHVLVPAVKAAIWSAVPNAVITEPRTFDEMFAGMVAQRKLNMVLLTLFGGLALLIAAIGIYGVMAFVVEQRTKEIGVRMALGARPSRILSMILSRAALAIGVGLAIGFLAAAWLERLVMAFVHRGVPHDPAVYGAAAALLLALGLLAAYLPARRAAHVDPLVAIRTE